MHTNVRLLVLALASAGLVAACGGGGGSSDNQAGPPPTTRQTGKISLTGVVAIGRAVAGTSVEVTCLGASSSNVSATATTAADGLYSVSLEGASLPCVLKADASGTSLTSLAQGSGPGTATANITPFTTLVTASVAGIDPIQYVNTFSATSAGALTGTAVDTAQGNVRTLLTDSGVSLASVGNFLTGTLTTPESGSANAYDAALDALGTRLTETGTTLADLSTTVATTLPATPPGTGTTTATSATPSLPADLLLQPHASNCTALRSGTYRALMLMPSANTADTAPVTPTELMTVDASTLTLSYATSGTSEQLVANGPCRYTGANSEEYVVSQAGIIVARVTDDAGVFRMGVALPQQSISLADLAGSWNALQWNAGSPAFSASAGTATLDATGKVTAANCFDQADSLTATATACQPVALASLPSMTANQAGGFTLSGTDPQSGPWAERWFAYRAGGGELMIVSLAPDGSFSFWTRQRTNQLPTVGTTTANWNFPFTNAILGAINSSSHVITSAGGTSFVRDNTVNLGTVTQTTRTETLQINSPRNGYTHRDVATNVREFVSMGLRGMGLTPLYLPPTQTQSAQFQLSVTQP